MYTIPTLQQLYLDVLTDLQTEFGGTIPTFGPNDLRALAGVQAGKLKLYYLAIGQLQKNIFVDTADPEATGGTLERFGRAVLGRNPFAATQGQYTVTITTTLIGGTTLPAGTVFKSDDSAQSPGKLFMSDSAQAITYPTGTATLRALEAGTDSRLAVGDTLTSTAPILDIDSAATVAAETAIPLSAETIENYRAAALANYRLYPQGGASADYRLWGLDAQGVKQIYPYAASGAPNEINVFVEATIIDSTDGMGTPTSTILTDVAADIEADPIAGAGRRPLGVFAVNTAAVIVNKMVITINSAATITAAQQTLITAALKQAVDAVRPFIPGADVLADRNDTFGVNNVIGVVLSTVPGSIFGTIDITLQVGAGTPASVTSRTFDNGNIPFLTTVTYVP